MTTIPKPKGLNLPPVSEFLDMDLLMSSKMNDMLGAGNFAAEHFEFRRRLQAIQSA